MNFKRGILSSFQNSMKRFDIDAKSHETDISGSCDVTYTVTGVQGTNLLVQKKKELPTCTNRYKTNSFLQTVPYDFRKQYSVLPILQSSSYCNVRLNELVNLLLRYAIKQTIYYRLRSITKFIKKASAWRVMCLRLSRIMELVPLLPRPSNCP